MYMKWRSPDEHPEGCEDVLVCYRGTGGEDGLIGEYIGYYLEKFDEWWVYSRLFKVECLAWMPLPEPPEVVEGY